MAKVTSLFAEQEIKISPTGDLIDALVAELAFVNGIEAALYGIEAVDTGLMEGAQELVRVHRERLRAIGKLAEAAVQS